MFSRQTISSMGQVLGSLPSAASDGLLYKHLGMDRNWFAAGLRGTIQLLEEAPGDDLLPLVKEIVLNRDSIRADAPTKYVFDERFADLERWLLHDGWRANGTEFQRLAPEVGDVVEVEDRLAGALTDTGLDGDGAVWAAVEQSAAFLAGDPPDFNASGTHARIALETLVRRSAQVRAEQRTDEASRDRWGDALSYLRQSGFLDQDEERTFAALYTFVSDAAHQPLSDEEWARLARTYCLSTCYYLARKWIG